ncbi:MAG: nucleotidyl transferase AbiEii/AbiGii toxin family protein [Anaerolineae bacterium]
MIKGKGLLTPLQKEVVTLFARLPDQEFFYLTGGTALSEFYLGHRISFDLDFFTVEAELALPFSRQMEAACLSQGLQVSVTRRFASFVEFGLHRGEESLRVDLTLDAPFRFAHPMLSEYGVWVNNFQDLKTEKVLAYYGRAEPRDAVDLYFIFQQEAPDHLLALAVQKDPGFDLYWFAVALNRAVDFPDEPERWPVKMLMDFHPPELKQTFQQLAMDLMSRLTARSPEEAAD